MHINSNLISQRVFLGVLAMVFAVSVTVTIFCCRTMSVMGEMSMPGGWTMSMMWMHMPGQTWIGDAASFLGMWDVMMVAMMLPSLIPMLLHYRQAAGNAGATRLARLTTLVGLGYYLVWTVFGLLAYLLGIALVIIEMRSLAIASAVPFVSGVVVLIAGVLQFSRWKAYHLACCRSPSECEHTLPAQAGYALRHGLRLGIHCSYCCSGLMAILLVLGVIDLRAMAVATVAMTVERLMPDGERVARVIGVAAIGVGLILIVRAAGLG